MNDVALETATSGEAPLELARALLRRGQTLAAIPFIQQAMSEYPEAAAELMAQAEAQIQAIQEVIERAVAEDSSLFAVAKRLVRAIAQIAITLNRESRLNTSHSTRRRLRIQDFRTASWLGGSSNT